MCVLVCVGRRSVGRYRCVREGQRRKDGEDREGARERWRQTQVERPTGSQRERERSREGKVSVVQTTMTDRQADSLAGRQAGRKKGRQADRQVGRKTGRQTDRKTGR